MRTAVVSGASSGIGLALVQRLLKQGDVDVVAVDRVRCPEAGVRTEICDLADPESVAAISIPPAISVVANVAGVPGTADPMTVLAVNTLGMRSLTARCLSAMSPHGRIVNVASVAAHRNTLPLEDIKTLLKVVDRSELADWLVEHPLTGSAAYDTSKRAVLEWTKSLAAALIDREIKVVSVSPGPTHTPILADFETSMGADAMIRSQSAVGRHAGADEVAAVVDFFLSPDASWVNGIDILVEGGLTATRSALLSDPLKGLQT